MHVGQTVSPDSLRWLLRHSLKHDWCTPCKHASRRIALSSDSDRRATSKAFEQMVQVESIVRWWCCCSTFDNFARQRSACCRSSICVQYRAVVLRCEVPGKLSQTELTLARTERKISCVLQGTLVVEYSSLISSMHRQIWQPHMKSQMLPRERG